MIHESAYSVGPTRQVLFLLDHDNLVRNQITPADLVIRAIERLPLVQGPIQVKLRAYGGWFQEHTTTDDRYQALTFYQNHCPAVMETNLGLVRLSFEFADELAVSQELSRSIPITHTLGIRMSAGLIITTASLTQCTVAECKLGDVRKWLRKKTACIEQACSFQFQDFFRRREQKQVDVHISVDLLWFAVKLEPSTAIAVVSDDLDILPAIVQASVQGASRPLLHLRSANRGPTYQDSLLSSLGVLQAKY